MFNTKSQGLSPEAKQMLNATLVNANNAPLAGMGNNPSNKMKSLNWNKLAAQSNKKPSK